MNAKWYFGTLIVTLTLLGVFQKQDALPNQEIVVQFVDAKVSKDHVQSAIADVKDQLQNIGATNIKVQEKENGTLKISYHSSINVAHIKEALSKENHLVIGYISNDQDQEDHDASDNASYYNLDIYEINKPTQSSDLGGKLVIEIKYDYDRFTNPNVYFPLVDKTHKKPYALLKTAYKANRNMAIIIDGTSHKEPEVRAGPIC